MTRKLLIGAAAAALTLGLAACGQPATEQAKVEAGQAVDQTQDAAGAAVGAGAAQVAAMDTDAFVKEAAVSGLYEIEAAKIAIERTANSGVKKAAQAIITDHEKAAAELKTLVDSGKAPGPLPTALDERRKGMIDNLKTATKADFDDRYLDQQTAAHNEAVTAFKGYAERGDNSDLKAFAAKVAPTLEMHKTTVAGLDKGTPADDKAGADLHKG